MTISQESVTQSHLSGETAPARFVNTFGRVIHRLSTMPSERPTPEEYYADQPKTVADGLRRVAGNFNPTLLYVKFGNVMDDIEANARIALDKSTYDSNFTED
jgi:hypothetical protein